jgi:biopolymer transport protein ExbD
MSWQLRHAGSPQAIGSLAPQQIAEGLVEGDYETSDEVMGPGENRWVPLEEHPHFAETVEAYNASLDEEEVDASEDHIDMNPLIDVCLVLLVIFIMAQSMAILDKVIEAPHTPKKPEGNRTETINIKDLPQHMIMLDATAEEGKEAVIKVEGQPVTLDDLPKRLKSIVFNNSKKNTLVIKHKGISHGTMVALCDAAAQANIRNVKIGVKPSKEPDKAPKPNKE